MNTLTLLSLLFVIIATFYLKSVTPPVSDKVANFKLIVISFDGFRYDYLSPNLTPYMHWLAKHEGVTGHMLSTFSTKTFPNHHSIATGLYQETHGIVHNCMYDPNFRESFADKEDGKSDRWWDNQISTPIYIANQLADPGRSSCCSPWIGCHVRYFGRHRARYHRHYNKSSVWEEQFEWSLKCMLNKQNPANLVMIYIDEPDLTGHSEGPFGHKTLKQVRKIDTFVAYVHMRLKSLGLDSNTNLILLSDHGLSEICTQRTVILDSFLNSSWYDAYGCNPVFHVSPRPGYELLVGQKLRQQGISSHFKTYSKREMPTRFHYRSHRRIHDYVVVADEGWSIHKNQEQAAKQATHKGQHGYDNLAKSMRPLFIAVGPSFKKGYLHNQVFMNVDLYPLMLKLLGIKSKQFYNEGNLTRVQSVLHLDK